MRNFIILLLLLFTVTSVAVAQEEDTQKINVEKSGVVLKVQTRDDCPTKQEINVSKSGLVFILQRCKKYNIDIEELKNEMAN